MQTTRASRFKRAAIGTFIISAGLICFILTHPSTSANLRVLGFETNQDGCFVIVQFSNSGPAIVSYPGYDTNQPWYAFELQTSKPLPVYPYPCELYPHAIQGWIDPRWFELKACQSVDFRVWTTAGVAGQPNYRVILDYFAPGRVDWFRKHAQYPRKALSQSVEGNSLVTEVE